MRPPARLPVTASAQVLQQVLCLFLRVRRPFVKRGWPEPWPPLRVGSPPQTTAQRLQYLLIVLRRARSIPEGCRAFRRPPLVRGCCTSAPSSVACSRLPQSRRSPPSLGPLPNLQASLPPALLRGPS